MKTRTYTPEEKQQLIQNLDIEVEHRVRQLEEWLAVALENFRLHQEGLISRIPKLVREVTMGEFADKYNGDIQACLRGVQSERMGGTAAFEIDKDTRKRKWAAAQEEAEASGSGHAHEADHARAAKNARMMTATPKKAVGGSSNASRAFAANRTPGALRTAATRPPVPKPSPSPRKPNKPPVPARATSPHKQHAATNRRTRPPSSATFNPTMLPPKAPTYPTLRAPRHDESMLSVNGSPLANPYTLGLGWFTGEDMEGEAGEEDTHLQAKGKEKPKDNPPSTTMRRVNSILIRRDPSVHLVSASSQPPPNEVHARANAQSQHTATHARTNSRTQALSPPVSAHNAPSSSASALVSLPTKDGHLLEFDPLTTSPRALDKLVGITDSAKKQAKEEMARLVKEAVRKWVIE